MEIWVFNGTNGKFPSGVFSGKKIAEIWIAKHKLSGVLTQYPLDEGVYDWAISSGFFTVKKEEENMPDFIQRFSSGSQNHCHYDNGNLE